MKLHWNSFVDKVIDLATKAGGKIIFAVIAFIIGLFLIKSAKKIIDKAQKKSKLDDTAKKVVKNIIIILLYVILALVIIEILGIPMTSIVAVIASCGLTVGLALQGALSNLAGGIMILIFKPFKVGDYVSAGGEQGSVKEISLFYTHLVTIDNKHITVPNGALMNSNVTNFSNEERRRVDLDFKVTNDTDEKKVCEILVKAAETTAGVIGEPSPFARLSSVDDDTFIFTVRAWCESAKYWDVYFDLLENCTNALAANGIDDPEERIAVRLVKDN